MSLTRPQRRQLILVWAALLALWGASMALALLVLPERLALTAGVGGAIALAVGGLVTRRVRAPVRRAVITVDDLHPARRRRRR